MGFDHVKSYTRCDLCPLGQVRGYEKEIICNADTKNDTHVQVCTAHGLRMGGINVNNQIGFIVDILAPLKQFVDDVRDSGIAVRGPGWDGEFRVKMSREKE